MKVFAALLAVSLVAPSSAVPVDETACLSQTETLASDQTIMKAVEDMASAIEAAGTSDILQFCDLAALSCTVPVESYSADVVTACQNAGGVIVEKDGTFSCSGSVGTIPIPQGVTIGVDNFPLCVGAACDPSALPVQLEQSIENSVDMVIDEVEAGLGGTITCESQGLIPDPTPTPAQATQPPISTSPAPTPSSTAPPSSTPVFGPSPPDGGTTAPPSSTPFGGEPQSVGPETVSNLQTTLKGVAPLTNDLFTTWIEVTVAWIIDFFVNNPEFGISDVDTSIEVISQDPPLAASSQPSTGPSKRFLQGEQVTLTYDQTITYTKDPDSKLTTLEVVTLPFESQTSRDEYTEKLRETGVQAFENILSTSAVDTSQASVGPALPEMSSGSGELPVLLSYVAPLAVGMGVFHF